MMAISFMPCSRDSPELLVSYALRLPLYGVAVVKKQILKHKSFAVANQSAFRRFAHVTAEVIGSEPAADERVDERADHLTFSRSSDSLLFKRKALSGMLNNSRYGLFYI